MIKPIQFDDRLLVLFDADCGLCNRAVRWISRRDRRGRLRFMVSVSAEVAGLLKRHGFDRPSSAAGLETILVVCDTGKPEERLQTHSEAVLALLNELPQPWPVISGALRWVPRPARDLAYQLIARWRYRIWGRADKCSIPTHEERSRFL